MRLTLGVAKRALNAFPGNVRQVDLIFRVGERWAMVPSYS